ncbi:MULTISPECIES: hypothetical protein [Sphingobacterium]|uniref:hypothetical protein n=1 Tax=Sphingobacterium TaxID=28453 RepID=UPI0013DA8F0B|nr:MULTISPECIES: hypothetical protein [unclassified Sphingobacterium]
MRSSVHVGIGIIWQCALTLIAMYIVVKEGGALLTSILVLVIMSLILKKNWYENLCRYEKEYNAFIQKNNL